jgi:hypothetical protein
MKRYFFYILMLTAPTLGLATHVTEITAHAEEKTAIKNPKEFISNFCSNYSEQNDFLKKMAQDIIPNDHTREYLVAGLKDNKLPGCKKALQDFMKKILAEKDFIPKAGEQGFLSLALLADIPEATVVIEREIDKGLLSSWIDKLKAANEAGYLQALNSWIKRVAHEIREKNNSQLQDTNDYGLLAKSGETVRYPDMIRIWTPILMNRYLNETIKRKTKLSETEFNHLNIIFAATTTSYRETFSDQIAQIVANNPQTWLLSFRREPTWVEFRLFPIMQKVAGGDIKREIIWLSKYHQDVKIRTLALNALEKLEIKKNNIKH